MTNEKLRKFLRVEGIPLWRLADAMGVSEPTVTRRLRHELPEGEQDRLIALVKEACDG